MTDTIIKIHNLDKTYKKTIGNPEKAVLNGLNMQVDKGDIYGLVGRNGAGKTTLLKCITGLILPTSGSIELFGENNPDRLYEYRAKIGGIVEKPPLDGDFSAWDNLKVCAIRRGITDERINEVLDITGLSAHGEQTIKRSRVKTFSLGMKQRLGISMALLSKPKLMIFDEPLNGLDPDGIIWFRNLVLDLRKNGITFIISSHLLRELDEVATCYGVMKNGRIIGYISAEELKQSGEDFESYYRKVIK